MINYARAESDSPKCGAEKQHGSFNMGLVLTPCAGVVPEQADEGQTAAPGDVLAPSGRPQLLHLHDDARCSHRKPALPFPLAHASTLLPSRRCHGSSSGRRSLRRSLITFRHLHPAPRHLPGAVPPLLPTGAPVQLQTPGTVPVASWPQQLRGGVCGGGGCSGGGGSQRAVGHGALFVPELPQQPGGERAGLQERRR